MLRVRWLKKSFPDETKLIAAPQGVKALKEDSRETTGVSDGGMEKEKTIDRLRKLEVTLLCLQAITLPPFGESTEELTSGKTGEDPKHEIIELETLVEHKEISSLEADEQEECNKEGRYNQGGKGNDKSAERRIITRKLERWPKLVESKDPSNHSLHPMEKRKIKGTFKNHKKKKVTTLMTYQQRNQWEEGTEEEGVVLDAFPEEHLYCVVAPSKLSNLEGNSDPHDLVELAEELDERKAEASEEKRKLQLHEPEI